MQRAPFIPRPEVRDDEPTMLPIAMRSAPPNGPSRAAADGVVRIVALRPSRKIGPVSGDSALRRRAEGAAAESARGAALAPAPSSTVAPARLDAPTRALSGSQHPAPPSRSERPRLGGAMALRDLLVAAGSFADVAPGDCCGVIADDMLTVVVSGSIVLRVEGCALATLARGDAFGFVPVPVPGLEAQLVAATRVRVARVSARETHAALAARPELATQIARAARRWSEALRRLPSGPSAAATREVVCPPRASVRPASRSVHALDELAVSAEQRPAPRSAPSATARVRDVRPRSGSACGSTPLELDPGDETIPGAWSRFRRSLLWSAIASGPVVIALLLFTQLTPGAREGALSPAPPQPATERSVPAFRLQAPRDEIGARAPVRRAEPARAPVAHTEPSVSRGARGAPR